MTPEERQLIDDLFMRMREASVEDRDREAEAHINQQVRNNPLAAYLLTQTVLVLEQNAEEQAQYIQELEARIQELEQNQRGGQGGTGGGGGFLGRGRSVSGPSASGRRDDQTYDARYEEPQGRPTSGSGIPQIGSRAGEYGAPYGTGGGRPPMGSPIPPQAPPGSLPPQQPPAQATSGGGGFLKTALATAAAVAGGVLVMDALKGVMGGGGGANANSKPGEFNDSNNDPADYQSSSSSSPIFNDDNNDPADL